MSCQKEIVKNVRIDPALHRQAALEAERNHMPLNQYVEKAIRAAVNG